MQAPSGMRDLLTWQLVDSAFPTGAFAHSWGLEAACQFGEVPDVPALRAYVDASIRQAGHAVLPLLNEAYGAPESYDDVDRLAHAFLTNVVANRASRVQGRALAATAARVWPEPAMRAVKARIDAGYAHLAPASGIVFRALGVPLVTAQRVVLFGTARGVLSAAVRLGLVGSYEAQRLQFDTSPIIDEVSATCAALGLDALAQTAPLIDLLQAQHDRLYSRLFQS
jgi:urease accessory protein